MSSDPFEINSERSRIRAAFVNSGTDTPFEAEEKLAASEISIVLGHDAALTPAGQAAFLTAVVTGAKCFGQVTIRGELDHPLLLPLPIPAGSMAEAASQLGARVMDGPSSASRAILIGLGPESGARWSVRAFWDGWVAGVAPGGSPCPVGRSDCALAGVAAGALAVGQSFLELQGDRRAGRTVQRLSLWMPEASDQGPAQAGPCSKETLLPSSLWLVGLGNLGQAYLWSIMMLPFPQGEEMLLVLQDDDCIGKENWGTSVLIQERRYGMLKTRLAEEWLTRRGFQVRRIDRRLDEHLILSPAEPRIALAGLDRIPPRRLLGGPGFKYVIDAGLGATFSDYEKFLINVFDSSDPKRNPAEHFKDVDDQTQRVVGELMQLPFYQELAKNSGDGGCGAAMLAEVPVAVPFVSAFVGALAVTQAIRLASGEAPHSCISGVSGDLRSVRAVLGEVPKSIAVKPVPAAY